MRPPHSLMVAAVAVGAAFLASLIDNDYYLRILFTMGVYYLCAAGMNVLVGYAGQKSLGQAGLFAAGAYTAALLTTSLDLNPWLALGAAAIAAGACGVLIAWPSLRVRGPYLAMVTLAFGIVVEKLVSCYLERRDSEAERFVDVVHRIGIEPFKETVYGNADQRAAHRNRARAVA